MLSLLLIVLLVGPPETVIRNVTVIPMDSERRIDAQFVHLRDGVIVGMGEDAQAPTLSGATVIDGTGKFLIPGIAEMHAHVPPTTQNPDYMAEVLFLYKANGITTVRGMLGHPLHLELREKAARGEIVSPRIYTSGPSINGQSAPTPEAVDRMVRAQKVAGYDLLKLHPGLSRATFDQMVLTANEVGIDYAGHVSDAVGLPRALEAKQISVDHLDGYIPLLIPDSVQVSSLPILFFGWNLIPHVDESLIPESVRRTKEAGIWNVPTQSLIEHLLGPDPIDVLASRPEMDYVPKAMLQSWRNAKQGYLDNPNFSVEVGKEFVRIRRAIIREMNTQGAGLLLGSDAPQIFNVPGFAIHHEMRMMVESGLSPYDVLRAGTFNVAQYFNEAETAGTIAVGKRADVVLLDADPLLDISHMTRLQAVWTAGYPLFKAEIDARLTQIRTKYQSP
jgi:imidazolonepropionase-like amidohydrolase